jgi:uncharacterized membrane protein (UPF0136 family)
VLNIARIVFFVFAALLIVGGIAGFVEKRSVPSLLAGVVCGGLGLYAGMIVLTRPSLALALALAGSILALGGMMPRLKNKETGQINAWPAGAVVAMSAVTALVAVAGLATNRGTTTPPGASGR